MGITIDWKGTETTISSSNAYAIYEDWVQGEIDLSTSQIKACEGFLTDEEIEEIEYENGGDEKTGASSIDTEGTDSSATGGAVAGTVGNFAAIWIMGTIMISSTGFQQLPAALAALAYAVVQKGLSMVFDTSYGDRTSQRDNADTTNSTLDGYTSSLEENFDTMNEDADAYSEATDLYTTSVNENVSKKADLQVQLQAAQAAGDTAGAASLLEEIAACDEEAEDITTDEMDEIQENMDEYASLGSEAGGASSSGQSVSDFLKQGTALGVIAGVNAALNLTAGVFMGVCAGVTIPKLAPVFPDLKDSALAKVNGYAAAAAFAAAAYIWTDKAKNEIECGSAGSGMQGHVDTLNSMIEEHSEYMTATTEAYEATDEESQESQEEAQEAAAEVTSNAASTTVSTKKKEEEEETTV